jgi:hypothetical protein
VHAAVPPVVVVDEPVVATGVVVVAGGCVVVVSPAVVIVVDGLECLFPEEHDASNATPSKRAAAVRVCAAPGPCSRSRGVDLTAGL